MEDKNGSQDSLKRIEHHRRPLFASSSPRRGPHVTRKDPKTKLSGVVVMMKEDRSFGFIKPRQSLPEEYTNKNVFFNPHGVNFQEGDTVDFVLRREDTARPCAQNVWLMKRSRRQIRHNDICVLGSIVKVIDDEGWIQIVGDVSEEYQGKVDTVYFQQSWVACGYIDLLPGDMVEFKVTQNKTRKGELSAYQIKLIECRQRTTECIEQYLNTASKMIDEEESVLNILSCDVMWDAVSCCKDMTYGLFIKVLDFIDLLQRKSKGCRDSFKQAMRNLTRSHFCDTRNGCLNTFIQTHGEQLQEDIAVKLRNFLLMILEIVPERSRMVVGMIRLMLPEGTDYLKDFFYNALKTIVQHTKGDMSDFNWRELPLVPNTSEMDTPWESSADLSEVRVKGPYETVEQYLDTYFRLLRADCFTGLLTGVRNYLNKTLDPRDMNIYTDVALAGVQVTMKGNGIVLALKVEPMSHVANWETSSNLISGNLLCISPSGSFEDAIWATVAERDVNLLKKKQTIWVELCNENNMFEATSYLSEIYSASGKIIMAESPTYYRAYQPVLKSLQQIVPREMPFQEELVYLESGFPSPNAAELEGLKLDSMLKGMETSQIDALDTALHNRVAIIQGPPGTGKTYVGIKIVEALLSSETTELPILILTYKNHALDEFLKELRTFRRPGEIVRIGGRSQEETLEDCNLDTLKRTTSRSNLWFDLERRASTLKRKVEGYVKELTTSRTVSAAAIFDSFTQEQIESLLGRYTWLMVFNDETGLMEKVPYKYILPIWQREREHLMDRKLPFAERCKEIPRILMKFIDAALEQWVPPKAQFEKFLRKEGYLLSFQVKKTKQEVKVTKDHEAMPDEVDAEEEERERMAFTGQPQKQKYTMDIDVFLENKKVKDKLVMSTSAQQYANEISLTDVQCIHDLWYLTTYDRVAVVQAVLWHHKKAVEGCLEIAFTNYKDILAEMEEVDNQRKLSILKRSKIVGMTITGASIHQSLMAMLQPAVVLVEEAAEVLEPQIGAVLGTCNVKHLVLIGDQKQLRPSVKNYDLRRDYHFDVSMMERLINNGYPYTVLKKQNRMRPEIAELLKDIYPDLESNLKTVDLNKPPDFTPASMFFWNHKDAEEAGRSYSNQLEAERVVNLALVFVQMGYKPDQITILAAYQGQVRRIRQMLTKVEQEKPYIFSRFDSSHEETESSKPGQRRTLWKSIHVHTIDLYQGDENDIIILSLVRSNDNGKIGFMNTLNRRCVAQSRARCGMYIIGNATTFTSATRSCWSSLINSLDEKKLVGLQFPFHCPLHKGITEIKATTGEDLPLMVICKEKCSINMECGIHPCPQVCRPKHSHAKCKVIIDFLLPCKHPAKRKCFQPERDIECKEPCSEMMDCGKHQCAKTCKPIHSHTKYLCTALVSHVFPTCLHATKKKCWQNESDLLCKRKVNFQFTKCQHTGERKCFEKEDDVICTEKCTRNLPCEHPCEGLCGNPCDNSKCSPCDERRKLEIERMRKAEKKARNDAREAAKRDLARFVLENPYPSFCRHDLHRDGDTASEYFDVEDRVRKYVQPGHGWFPEVTRIEKVINVKLQSDWIRAKSEMRNPLRSELKFHGTNQNAIESIVKDGFMLPRHHRCKGMYGDGIYFATDSSKSAQAIYTKGSKMLLLCDILIGQSRTVNKPCPNMTLGTLRESGYDSVFASCNTSQTGGVRYDEYVIFDPAQALPMYVIHYKTCTMDTIQMLGASADAASAGAAGVSKTKHVLCPKKSFDPNDPLDMHFRLAESQFLRLTQACGSDEKVKCVEYYVNPQLIDLFEKKKEELEKDRGPAFSKTFLAFHGTEEKNIESIMENNFSMERCKRGVHGAGIYLSELPDISKTYARGARKLILCRLLPGKGFSGGGNGARLEPGFDSHMVKKDTSGFKWAHVIYNSHQILPMYVIHY